MACCTYLNFERTFFYLHEHQSLQKLHNTKLGTNCASDSLREFDIIVFVWIDFHVQLDTLFVCFIASIEIVIYFLHKFFLSVM